jgi:hypothetical protein
MTKLWAVQPHSTLCFLIKLTIPWTNFFNGEFPAMEEETKFHWAEGMKYVAEGIKGVFLLNGAASISMLTFMGNTKTATGQLIIGLLSFAFGALAGPIAFCFAYLAQLHYGNEPRSGSKSWTTASKYHTATYWTVAIGMILFVIGIAFTSYGLWSALPLKMAN